MCIVEFLTLNSARHSQKKTEITFIHTHTSHTETQENKKLADVRTARGQIVDTLFPWIKRACVFLQLLFSLYAVSLCRCVYLHVERTKKKSFFCLILVSLLLFSTFASSFDSPFHCARTLVQSSAKSSSRYDLILFSTVKGAHIHGTTTIRWWVG